MFIETQGFKLEIDDNYVECDSYGDMLGRFETYMILDIEIIDPGEAIRHITLDGQSAKSTINKELHRIRQEHEYDKAMTDAIFNNL